MGLDQYAFTTKLPLTQKVSFSEPKDVAHLYYWRKHPNLHGWMEALYRRKGGDFEDFNFEAVVLDSDDLSALEKAVLAGRLPRTAGFFFGQSSGSEDERKDDLEFIKKARAAIAAGRTVFYIADW